MDVDIETLAKYPMESDDWIITVGIGGAAAIFSFFIVPIFAITGYMVRAIRAGMEGAEEPPVFDEWGDLLKEGFVAAIISMIYQIIPMIVFVVFVLGSLVALFTGSEAGAGLGMLGLFGGIFAWWLLSMVFGYVGMAGVANYAREGNFAAGFDFGVITSVITSREYVIAWVYVIGLNVAVSFLTSFLNIIPFVGAIIGIFVSFYALIIAGWLWGDGFAAATEETVETTPDVDATAA